MRNRDRYNNNRRSGGNNQHRRYNDTKEKKMKPLILGFKATSQCILTLDVDEENTEKRDGVANKNFAKFRCKSATVLKIRHFLTGEPRQSDHSCFDVNFTYEVGQLVHSNGYNTDKNALCTYGIHYYKSVEAAEAEFAMLHEKELRELQIPFKIIFTDPKSGRLETKKFYDNEGRLTSVEYYNEYSRCYGVDKF